MLKSERLTSIFCAMHLVLLWLVKYLVSIIRYSRCCWRKTITKLGERSRKCRVWTFRPALMASPRFFYTRQAVHAPRMQRLCRVSSLRVPLDGASKKIKTQAEWHHDTEYEFRLANPFFHKAEWTEAIETELDVNYTSRRHSKRPGNPSALLRRRLQGWQ